MMSKKELAGILARKRMELYETMRETMAELGKLDYPEDADYWEELRIQHVKLFAKFELINEIIPMVEE